jgi:rod shape determining protein RodA
LPYLVAVVLLVLVLVPGVGTVQFNARRWLFGFQPSEFAKLAMLLATAFLLTTDILERPAARLGSLAIALAAPLGLVALQPDLGSALVLLPVAWSMLFVAGTAPRFLAWTTLVALAAAALFLGAILLPERLPPDSPLRARIERVSDRVIFPHWKKRILVFADPDRDPLGAGWNLRQSQIAVGAGGLRGKGRLNGTQNILGFLPRAVSSTDFIFSVYAEECGFAGSLLLLGLYAGLFASIAAIGIQCADTTGRLLAAGVLTLFGFHVFVNIAMTVGRVPITGLPLPLISYGGSFTISTMAMLGLVQSVALHGRPPAKSTNP